MTKLLELLGIAVCAVLSKAFATGELDNDYDFPYEEY